MNWTNKKIDKLKELWEQGDVATEIAKVFGVTKNAIIGKANRLNFTPRKRGGAYGIKHPRESAPITIESENPTSLESLTSDQCKFPLWDKPTDPELFCGRRRWDKASYCKMHYEKSHIKNPRSL